MKHTRKWLVFLLCAMLLMSNLSIYAMAVENESPIALHAAVSGSTVQVQVLATKAQTVADGKLVLTFDAEKLDCLKAEPGAAWTSTDHFAWSQKLNDGKVILTFANAEAAAEGVLFTLTFDAAADAVISLDGSSYISGVSADLAQEVNTCPSVHLVDVANLFPEAHDAVDFMVSKGYMKGISDTLFAPHMDLNRAMMVTTLHRIAGSPTGSGTHNFVDVPDNKFYTAPVIWAVENNITSGVSENLFAPDKSLTRQELVTFLYRFAEEMGYDRTATTDLSAYTDAGEVQPYAVEAFQWAVAEGVIKGTTDTTLDPEATTTRAQVSLMVYRLLSKQN